VRIDASGLLEGQLIALNWSMGWKWERPLEEWWSQSNSIEGSELVDAWQSRLVAPDGEKEVLEK
jgi:hypothetical protein